MDPIEPPAPAHVPAPVPAKDAAAVRLVARVARALGRPMDAATRDAQVARAAAAARGRSRLTIVRRIGERPLVPAGLVAAALAGVLVVRVVLPPDLPVLALGDAGAGARGGAEGAAMMADAGGPAILPYVPVDHDFVLAEGLTAPAGAAPAWRLEPPADLPAAAARLAATLGLPAPTPSEWDPASLVAQDGPDGAGGASLWVGANGDWSYSGAYEVPDPTCVLIDPRPADLGGGIGDGAGDASSIAPPVTDCPAPTPPARVPDAARARTLALELFAATGMTGVRITDVFADEWGAWVSGVLPIEGAADDVGPWVGVGFGGDARIVNANGTLARPERLGDYPLVDLEAAVARMEEWYGGGAAPLPAEGEPEPAPYGTGESAPAEPAAPDSPAAAPEGEGESTAPGEPGPPDTPVTDAPPAPEPAPIEPTPSEPLPTVPAPTAPERVTVVLVRVELVTGFLWTPDGRMLLVPHFRFHDADGGIWEVVAVEDRYVSR